MKTGFVCAGIALLGGMALLVAGVTLLGSVGGTSSELMCGTNGADAAGSGDRLDAVDAAASGRRDPIFADLWRQRV